MICSKTQDLYSHAFAAHSRTSKIRSLSPLSHLDWTNLVYQCFKSAWCSQLFQSPTSRQWCSCNGSPSGLRDVSHWFVLLSSLASRPSSTDHLFSFICPTSCTLSSWAKPFQASLWPFSLFLSFQRWSQLPIGGSKVAKSNESTLLLVGYLMLHLVSGRQLDLSLALLYMSCLDSDKHKTLSHVQALLMASFTSSLAGDTQHSNWL